MKFNVAMEHYKTQYLEYRKVTIATRGRKSTIFPWRMSLRLKIYVDYNYNLIETLIEELKPGVMGDKRG